MASDPSPAPAPTVGKAALAGLLLRYLDAREALHAANNGAVHKLGVLHQGRAFCVQFGADGITGMAVAEYVGDPNAPADTTPAPEAPTKRGRPRKAAEASADVEKPTDAGAAPAEAPAPKADAPAAPAAPVVEKKPMTKDEYRAYASRAALKLGVPKVREINGGAIDEMDPAVFPAKAAELDAAVKAKEGL